MTVHKPSEEHAAFRQQRLAMLTGPRGSLSMIAMPEITATPRTFDALPGWWSRCDGADGVSVSAAAADNLRIDGRVLDGTTVVGPQANMRFSETVTAGVGQEVDGTWYLQVSDTESAALAAFAELETYAYDAAWIIDARYRARPESDRPSLVGRQGSDELHRRDSPAQVEFTLLGEAHCLAVLATAFDDWATVNFTDQTSGSETPSAGRILAIPRGTDRTITLDFNRAMLPPHESSSVYPCPVPPSGNHLPMEVRAGERALRFDA